MSSFPGFSLNLRSNKLTPEQLNKLKKQFAYVVADSMDLDTLIEIVTDSLFDAYSTFNESEMKEEIVNYYCDDNEEYNNLVNQL